MKIFLCYAPSDGRTTSKLALDLMKRGFDVWMDQPDPQGESVPPEQRQIAIEEGIETADLVIVIVSPTALTSPDLHGQTAFANQKGKKIAVAVREECEFTAAIEQILEGKPRYDFSRAKYTESLYELLKSLGVDPTLIVKDIVSELEADEWMPGNWRLTFMNPKARVDGMGDFRFGPEKEAEGKVTVLYNETVVSMEINGTWDFVQDRFTIQGQSQLHVSIDEAVLPQHMTYVMSLQVKDLQRDYFEATSSVGDTVTFQKLSELAPN